MTRAVPLADDETATRATRNGSLPPPPAALVARSLLVAAAATCATRAGP